jgi:hypothetical protein
MSTRFLTNYVRGLREALSAEEKIFDALPECGGVVTGDACSGVTSGTKIGFAALIAGASIVRTNGHGFFLEAKAIVLLLHMSFLVVRLSLLLRLIS